MIYSELVDLQYLKNISLCELNKSHKAIFYKDRLLVVFYNVFNFLNSDLSFTSLMLIA